MKWRKSPPALIGLFENMFPGPPAEQRKMFGYPAGFVNGNLFMGLFENEFMLRLPEGERQELLAAGKAKIFAPMPGRPMREYVSIPDALAVDKKELAKWVAKSCAFGASLKPKSKTTKKSKTKSSSAKSRAKRS